MSGEILKEIGYQISLSTVFISVLFLSFIALYLSKFGFFSSLAISLTLAFLIYFFYRKMIENIRKSGKM